MELDVTLCQSVWTLTSIDIYMTKSFLYVQRFTSYTVGHALKNNVQTRLLHADSTLACLKTTDNSWECTENYIQWPCLQTRTRLTGHRTTTPTDCAPKLAHDWRWVSKHYFSVGIPTYAGMITGFHADVSPRNQFSHRRRSE